MECKECGNEIVPWFAPEIWSGEIREIIHDEHGLCNSCELGCDGVLEIIDIDEMYKLAETLPPVTFSDYLKTIPGMKIATDNEDGFWIIPGIDWDGE